MDENFVLNQGSLRGKAERALAREHLSTVKTQSEVKRFVHKMLFMLLLF
jgi:hypothetical protein